jgi:Uma2 family endonuclease
MTIKMAQAPPTTPSVADALPDLPTFPLEAGFREIYDPETGTSQQVPLTLLDFLYPSDEDVGVVIMPESPIHDIWATLLAIMLRSYLAADHWLVLRDVIVHWGRRGAPAKAPDLAAIPGGRLPEPKQKSYRVGRDGTLPSFVLELTSAETRSVDLQEKPLLYAAVGVKEFLIIDLLPEGKGAWHLTGYRLEDTPFYHKLQPDAEGGLTFETVGLRFVAIGQERVEVYEVATGERLLTPTELMARAEAEAARAEAEAARAEAEATGRIAAETRAAELATRLRELEARYGIQGVDEPPVKSENT